MLIRRAQIEGRSPIDVRLQAGRIETIAPGLDPYDGEETIDAEGGALLPGLHDHHIHLMALAASLRSVPCGPPDVTSEPELRGALVAAASNGDAGAWIRGVGYHESVAGPLDRDRLDTWLPHHPVRLQHRSGALWVLNSQALALLGDAARSAPPNAERDAAGRLTGRLFRLDRWLQRALGGSERPSLRDVGRLLADAGVTGVTDATPSNDRDAVEGLAGAVRRDELRQRVVAMGGPELRADGPPEIERGSLKILLDDVALPELDTLCEDIRRAHRGGRHVAFHCVTRTQLVFALGALEAAGATVGDRIEHASVAPPELVALLRERGVTVVTQPGFIRERGDVYATEVDGGDRPWLYRCRGFVDAGVPLGAGTDAPFGRPDPWLAMQAAVDRRSEAGLVLGEGERLSPERALALFTSAAEAPGGRTRRIEPGAQADLCLLAVPWARASEQLDRSLVRATIRQGERIGGRG